LSLSFQFKRLSRRSKAAAICARLIEFCGGGAEKASFALLILFKLSKRENASSELALVKSPMAGRRLERVRKRQAPLLLTAIAPLGSKMKRA
jgi:hypothetical protein